jgi:hypothetical protein
MYRMLPFLRVGAVNLAVRRRAFQADKAVVLYRWFVADEDDRGFCLVFERLAAISGKLIRRLLLRATFLFWFHCPRLLREQHCHSELAFLSHWTLPSELLYNPFSDTEQTNICFHL